MAARMTRYRTAHDRRANYWPAGRPGARGRYVEILGRAGLAARGVMYMIVGWLAIQVAVGHLGHKADPSGAMRLVASTPVGAFALWLLAIGFVGLTVWRLSEAVYGGPGREGRKTGTRVAAAFRVLLYGFLAFTILKFALGLGAPPSSNKTSRDLTATLMRHPGGVALVGLLGVALISGGVFLACKAWERDFLKNLRLAQMSPRVRRAVEVLGRAGGVARGTVFTAAGIFLLVAAVHARPGQAKGIDATLRALASTPAGPWLLAAVAIGLILFGVYSCAEARWRRL